MELAYINTSHPDFIGGKQAVAQLNKRFAQQQQREQQAKTEATLSANSTEDTKTTKGGTKTSVALNKENVDDITMNLNKQRFDMNSGSAAVESSSKQQGGFFNIFKPSDQHGASSTIQ